MRAALLIGLLAACVVALWWNFKVHRHYRRLAKEHPERLPHGKQLLLRVAPLVVLSLGGVVLGIAWDRPVLILLSGLAAVGFCCSVWRLWHPRAPLDASGGR